MHHFAYIAVSFSGLLKKTTFDCFRILLFLHYIPLAIWIAYNFVYINQFKRMQENYVNKCLQVMRSACAGMGSSANGVSNGSIGSKEVHYVLRVLGPAACRSFEIFKGVACDTLQIGLPPQNKILRGINLL